MSSLQIIPITKKNDMETAWKIRKIVFVQEQACPEELEFEFEEESNHFLAFWDQQPAGTCRWRKTSNGIKLERFAVLPAFRRKGIGDALLNFVLKETEPLQRKIYLHAQISAMPLYAKNGFKIAGEQFEEAGIKHYKMVKD